MKLKTKDGGHLDIDASDIKNIHVDGESTGMSLTTFIIAVGTLLSSSGVYYLMTLLAKGG